MIYLKIEKPETISELLIALFQHSEGHYYVGTTTYSDEKCEVIQCENGKWRSFDDVYEIINTYFPGTDEKEIMHQILTTDFKRRITLYYPYFVFCSKIQKSTMILYPHIYSNSTQFTYKKVDSKYCWGELFELLGIRTNDDKNNYIEQNRFKQTKNEEQTITETV